MRVLVTGGCGFIGSNFILAMLRERPDWTIVNADKLTYAGRGNNLASLGGEPRYRFLHADIRDAQAIDAAVRECDLIVHFAAESHVDRSIANATQFVRTNVEGTLVLLDAAVRHGGKRFHHISTDEVFGELGATGSFSESSPYAPRSPYAASKAGSDHLVRAAFHTHGLPVTISNCSNNYGPYQHPEKLIPLFVTNLLEGKKVPLYGDGRNVRDWLHVEDHVRAIDLVIARGRIGETYCVGGGAERSNLEVARALLRALGKTEEMIERVPDRKGHDFRYAIDATKIREELGWAPRIGFEDGIARTVAWYGEHEAWWKPLKE